MRLTKTRGMTKELRALVRQELRARYQKIGSRGGKNRAANMSAEARTEQARKAVTARWEKARAARQAVSSE